MNKTDPRFQGGPGVCDVHDLVDDDQAPRKIAYCPKCDAWMCDECGPKLGKRAKAWFIRGTRRLKGQLGLEDR